MPNDIIAGINIGVIALIVLSLIFLFKLRQKEEHKHIINALATILILAGIISFPSFIESLKSFNLALEINLSIFQTVINLIVIPLAAIIFLILNFVVRET